MKSSVLNYHINIKMFVFTAFLTFIFYFNLLYLCAILENRIMNINFVLSSLNYDENEKVIDIY